MQMHWNHLLGTLKHNTATISIISHIFACPALTKQDVSCEIRMAETTAKKNPNDCW